MDQSLQHNSSDDGRLNFKVITLALVISVFIMAVKFAAYWITASSAILSDALESIINVAAGSFALAGVVVSARPPDRDHPYGHGKIEYFSAGFEGALIVIAAIGIFYEGIGQILDPRPLPQLGWGLAMLLAVSVVNLTLGYTLIKTGKRTGSMALTADGKHLMTDVYTSSIVLVGLLLVKLTGNYVLDGVVACLAGVNIVYTGVKLIKQAFARLMDSSDPELLEEISRILDKSKKDIWIDVHKLRAWRSGARVHIDFHLILPRDLPLMDGHREVKELEAIFTNYYKSLSDVLIHLDPCADPDCPICGQDPCDKRKAKKTKHREWNAGNLINDSP